MSCYEWERGSIKIPSKEWADFRRSLINHFNTKQEELYLRAKDEYKKLLLAGKGKRNFDFRKQLGLQVLDLDWEYRWRVESSIFPEHGVKRPKSPKRKSFEKATTKTAELGDYISFQHDTRVVNWNVGDNNHACETARDSYMGKKFFLLLDRITWIRGSGGNIVGNDEYNREAEYDGGGGNYVTSRFEPKKKSKVRGLTNYYTYYDPQY